MDQELEEGLSPSEAHALSERTIISVVRTAIYSSLGVFFATHQSEGAQLLYAAVLGGTLADFITWLIRSLMELPENLGHGGYDAAVNIVFACIFFHAGHLNPDDDGTAIAAAFVVFMVVLGVKMGYYGLQAIQAMERE